MEMMLNKKVQKVKNTGLERAGLAVARAGQLGEGLPGLGDRLRVLPLGWASAAPLQWEGYVMQSEEQEF